MGDQSLIKSVAMSDFIVGSESKVDVNEHEIDADLSKLFENHLSKINAVFHLLSA